MENDRQVKCQRAWTYEVIKQLANYDLLSFPFIFLPLSMVSWLFIITYIPSCFVLFHHFLVLEVFELFLMVRHLLSLPLFCFIYIFSRFLYIIVFLTFNIHSQLIYSFNGYLLKNLSPQKFLLKGKLLHFQDILIYVFFMTALT